MGVTDDDSFLVTRRARIAFAVAVMTGIVVVNGVAAGVAAFTVLGVLTVSVPGVLAGVEPVAAAWWIAVVLMALECVRTLLEAPFTLRRGLGQLLRTGDAVPPPRPKWATVANKVGDVLARVAAAAYVLGRELHGSAAIVVLVTLATAGALVTVDVLLQRWYRLRNRRHRQLGNRRRQDRSVGDGLCSSRALAKSSGDAK